MKRRVLAIALAALMLVALLAACGGGGGSKNEGKYVLNKRVMDGEEWDLASFAELMDTDVDSIKNMFTIELKSGGKATLVFGDEEPDDATWKVDGEKLIFSAEGETLEASIKNGTITLEEDGSVMEFVKAK